MTPEPHPAPRSAPPGELSAGPGARGWWLTANLLYRTPDRWRITVAEMPDAIGCGDLPDTPPDAPVETAQQELLEVLRKGWNFTGQLTWTQTKPDWWAAEPTETTNKIV